MKKALATVFCALIIAGVFAACNGGSMPVSVNQDVKQNVIRLHILANSDSSADQNLKLRVRNLLLKDWSEKLAEAGSATDAWKELNSLLPDIKKDISDFLCGKEAGYGVELKTGVYTFPDKEYNGVVFPEGKYHALRVELGSGAGQNWWCVMFPPLCLIGEEGDMDMDEYVALVQALEDKGISPDTAPDAPVRSWLYDQVFGGKKWDSNFLQWAKDYWLGGEDK